MRYIKYFEISLRHVLRYYMCLIYVYIDYVCF